MASLRRGAVNRQDLDWSISARSCWITAEIAGLLDTIEIDALDECGKTTGSAYSMGGMRPGRLGREAMQQRRNGSLSLIWRR